ncbi:MAG: hypothetical protein ABI318_06580, partial [Chthoniobacteraceae bacterium]
MAGKMGREAIRRPCSGNGFLPAEAAAREKRRAAGMGTALSGLKPTPESWDDKSNSAAANSASCARLASAS